MRRKCKFEVRGWRGGRAGSEPVSWRAVAILIGVGLVVGCATPEDRYRTLRIFFDDVPLPESMRPVPVAVEEVASVASRVSKQPTFEWVVHDPECDECHTSEATQLAYAEAPTLCWDCHDEEDFTNSFDHGPFAAGACLQCHTPHKSQYASLLLDSPGELCRGCHDANTFVELEQHRAEEGDDCIRCHNPHSAPRNYLLKENPDPAPVPDPVSESAPVPALEPLPASASAPLPVPAPESESASGPGTGP
jgi:predicted CXXCH cytochrome family protein